MLFQGKLDIWAVDVVVEPKERGICPRNLKYRLSRRLVCKELLHSVAV